MQSYGNIHATQQIMSLSKKILILNCSREIYKSDATTISTRIKLTTLIDHFHTSDKDAQRIFEPKYEAFNWLDVP